MWPDCSPPRVQPAPPHLVEHVAIADLGHRDLDARRLHRPVEAVVGHHGDDDAAVELTARRQPARSQRDQLVTVVDAAVAVDRQHAIGIAVEGEADFGAGAGDALGQRLEVGGPTAGVDVAPIGLGPDHVDLGPKALEDRRRGAVGGAVGAVEDDAAAGEVEWEGGLQLAQVVVEAAVELAHAPRLHRDRGRHFTRYAVEIATAVVEAGLDPRLELVAELRPLAGEELDAVVAIGVVGGGDDGGEVEPQPLDEDRGGGGRQHTAEQRVASGGGDPGSQGGLQHRPRLAGVADDQDLGALGLQRGGGGATECRRQLRGKERASLPSDPIGSEELALGAHQTPVSAC